MFEISEKDNCCVYIHRRLDTNEVFYVGITSRKDYKRAYEKTYRSNWWNKVVKKAGYVIDIVYKNISWEQAKKYEINLIAMYGRRDLKTGNLVNLTGGGEGGFNPSEETREKLRKRKLGAIVSDKCRQALINHNINRKWTEESKLKISRANKGRKRTELQKLQYSKIIRYNAKVILNLETGIFYDNLRLAAEAYNMTKAGLQYRASKNLKQILYV